MPKLFPVFRAGTYPQGAYSIDDVKELAEKYDPNFLSAPFTIDHKQDGPAFGYARSVNFENDTLFASADDLAEGMKKAVSGKHFNRVSVEIYKNLPEKGRYLKAISFLGVKAPQVKGLEDGISKVEFQDAESETIEFEVKWPDDADHFELVEKTSNEQSAKDNASKELEKQIAKLEAEKKDLEAQVGIITNKFQSTDTERAQAEEKLNQIMLNQRRLNFESFLNEQIAYGNLAPADHQKVMDLLTALASIDMFEAEEGREIKPVELFQEFIKGLPKILSDEEVATKDKASNKKDFSDYQEIVKEAQAYQQAEAETGHIVGSAEAVTYIVNKNKE